MRAGVIALSVLSALIYVSQLSYRAARSHRVEAPCSDAIGAFLVEHWECTRLSYTKRRGLHFVCIGDDYQIDDDGMLSDRKLAAFLYTNLSTMKQGYCDCTRPTGTVCEDLE